MKLSNVLKFLFGSLIVFFVWITIDTQLVYFEEIFPLILRVLFGFIAVLIILIIFVETYLEDKDGVNERTH